MKTRGASRLNGFRSEKSDEVRAIISIYFMTNFLAFLYNVIVNDVGPSLRFIERERCGSGIEKDKARNNNNKNEGNVAAKIKSMCVSEVIK